MLLTGITFTSGGRLLYKNIIDIWIKSVDIRGKYSSHNKTNKTKRQVTAQKHAVYLKKYRYSKKRQSVATFMRPSDIIVTDTHTAEARAKIAQTPITVSYLLAQANWILETRQKALLAIQVRTCHAQHFLPLNLSSLCSNANLNGNTANVDCRCFPLHKEQSSDS